jgi:hypothetical protein
MYKNQRKKAVKKPRVRVIRGDIERLFEISGTQSVASLARRKGLPYLMVYNIVNGRVKSVSNRHYEVLFGETAPTERQLKVDGAAFRAMVRLWLFLNSGLTAADLYQEMVDSTGAKRPDHRIFNGKIRTVDAKHEQWMRNKFFEQGIDSRTLDRWLDEHERLSGEDRVPYDRVRPLLRYLAEHVGIPPNTLLKRSAVRYEKGELKRVSYNVYARALALKQAAEKALAENREKTMEQIRESIVGGKPGYTLYKDIKNELHFLRMYGGKSAKGYLGRGLWTYEKGSAKRIETWRAERIMDDCDRFIRESAALLTLSDLPPSRKQAWNNVITHALNARATQLVSAQDTVDLEKTILQPTHLQSEYKNQGHGFTPFDRAPKALGMNRQAFDLMVAGNCEIFRMVGMYANRWYLSDLYLKEISERKNFNLISAKYELLAKQLQQPQQHNACMN